MTTDTFEASVTYGDWTGTAAADNADFVDLAKLLEDKKVYDFRKEFWSVFACGLVKITADRFASLGSKP